MILDKQSLCPETAHFTAEITAPMRLSESAHSAWVERYEQNIRSLTHGALKVFVLIMFAQWVVPSIGFSYAQLSCAFRANFFMFAFLCCSGNAGTGCNNSRLVWSILRTRVYNNIIPFKVEFGLSKYAPWDELVSCMIF